MFEYALAKKHRHINIRFYFCISLRACIGIDKRYRFLNYGVRDRWLHCGSMDKLHAKRGQLRCRNPLS